MGELDIASIFNDVAQAAFVAVAMSVLTPLLQILDISNKRAANRRALEDIRIIKETDELLYGEFSGERAEACRARYESIIAADRELRELTLKPEDRTVRDPFDLGDWFAGSSVPVIIFTIIVWGEDNMPSGDYIGLACGLAFSLLLAFVLVKYVVCRYLQRWWTQKMAAFALSFLIAMLGVALAAMIAALLE